ncbi:hypothetical protein J9B83_12490 [Marinomonas sp. A79]|uniref:Aggregation factor core n=1 Tax=Marinomonas vulgaris TaxID=2823372 RepID=A0ABS5HDL1_9GAMM|nr:hypothetical protein [Marinomonas vulgaris]MBR7889753.1 hypothetical protein [Marinomonas vulgaris]
MFKLLAPITASVILLAAQAAHADIEVSFVDSAPKDRFVITNMGECVLNNVELTLDLSNSVGRLIFDTTATGAGVEVFQPFEVRKGELTLLSASNIQDGDSSLSLMIETIDPKGSVSFTIDVDDTLVKSEYGNIRVSGSEIANGNVMLTTNKTLSTATFNSYGKALVTLDDC